MPLATEYELLRQASADLDSARHMLLSPSPETVGRAVPLLEAAASKLAWLERRLKAANPESESRERLRPQMLAIKGSLGEVHALILQASDFFSGWAALVGLAAPGYGRTPGISPAPRTLTVEG